MKLNEIAARQPTTVLVRYHSQYNGVDIFVNGREMTYGDDHRADQATDAMVDWAGQMCDEDGVFQDDMTELTAVFTHITKSAFGDDVVVSVEEDNIGS